MIKTESMRNFFLRVSAVHYFFNFGYFSMHRVTITAKKTVGRGEGDLLKLGGKDFSLDSID